MTRYFETIHLNKTSVAKLTVSQEVTTLKPDRDLASQL